MSTMMTMFLIIGLFLAGLSIPLILGIIPPNGLYGFRIRKTIENPEIWYPVNKRAGIWLLVLGVSVVLAAAGFALIPNITIDRYSLSILGVVLVVFAITLIDTVRYMNAL
jgi:hypothetical protein